MISTAHKGRALARHDTIGKSGLPIMALSLVILAFMLAGPAAAKNDKLKGPGNDKPDGAIEEALEKAVSGHAHEGAGVLGIGEEEGRLIRDYFAAHPMQPQGLPPGIAKNVARGKPLPPGIAKKFLPDGLRTQLPLRDGYEYTIVGDDVVLIEAATRVVVDILTGAL